MKWASIKCLPGYSICEDGRVKDPKGKIVKPYAEPGRYLMINVMINRKSHTRRIHRLLCLTFKPPTQEDVELGRKNVDHINRNKQDNRLENLRWVTHSDNNRNVDRKAYHGYYGVMEDTKGNRFRAYIWRNNKRKYFGGNFKSAEAAARMYDKEVRQFAGPDAPLNFPETI